MYHDAGVRAFTRGATYSDGLIFTRILSHYIMDRFEKDTSCDAHIALRIAERLRNRLRCDFKGRRENCIFLGQNKLTGVLFSPFFYMLSVEIMRLNLFLLALRVYR